MNVVLVPTDFSDTANIALRFAWTLAENTSSRIVLLHWREILIPTSTPQHLYRELYEEQKEIRRQELIENVSGIVNMLKNDGRETEITYIAGDGASLKDALISAVKELQADVIVMGTQGASGLKKLFVGSNTAQIIEVADVPVIAVPSGYEFRPIEKIGYASDLKDVVNEIGELVRFAGLFSATIEIFHVYPAFPVVFEVNQENVDRLLEELVQKYPGQKFSIRVIQTYKDNDIVHGIEKYISSFKPDLLAMFTLKRNFLDKLFDASRTEEIAFNTHVPLLTLKKSEYENI